MAIFFPLKWVSSTAQQYAEDLDALAQKMHLYYSRNSEYYSQYISHEWLWNNPSYLPFSEIRKAIALSESTLEVGCGNAAVLQCNAGWQRGYTGIDFSESLIQKNSKLFPEASFFTIQDAMHYPFDDNHFDLVFSTFVIEHTVYPKCFLDECFRVLKPGGQLIVMGPNFLDYGWMPSQRVNSNGLGSKENLKRGKLIDSLSTFFYNRFIIPAKCKEFKKADVSFVINLDPSGLDTTIPMAPDVDATYVTSFEEMRRYLVGQGGLAISSGADFEQYLDDHRLGFLRIQKLT